jgi:hypothetical protein
MYGSLFGLPVGKSLAALATEAQARQRLGHGKVRLLRHHVEQADQPSDQGPHRPGS